MCVSVRREYTADTADPERAARFASAALLKVLQPADWQISSDVELVVSRYVQAMRDQGGNGSTVVQVIVHASYLEVVVGSDDPDWVDEHVRLRPRRPFEVTFDCHDSTPRYERAPHPALWPALGRPRVENTPKQWRETWDALHEVTQSIRDAGDDLTRTLDAIAAGVVAGTVFTIAAVNLADEGNLVVVSVHGSAEARQALLGTAQSEQEWAAMLEDSVVWGSLRFLQHEKDRFGSEFASWIPPGELSTDPDRWDPRNALFAPLYSLEGVLVGVLSVDLPAGSPSPGVGDLERLEVFADHAAAAIERAQALALQV